MKIIVKDNKVLAIHSDEQIVEQLYPTGSVSYIVPEQTIEPRTDIRELFDLQTAKNMQRQLITKQLDDTRKAGFVCSANMVKVQCTEQDYMRLLQAKAIMELSNADVVSVRDYNNINVPVSKVTFLEMLSELGNYINTLLQDAWAKKDAINACETVEQVFS